MKEIQEEGYDPRLEKGMSLTSRPLSVPQDFGIFRKDLAPLLHAWNALYARPTERIPMKVEG